MRIMRAPSPSVWDLAGRRDARVIAAQAQVSALLVGAALCYRESAADLRRDFVGWPLWSWPLIVAAVGLVFAAMLPWMWRGTTVRVQRFVTWSSIGIGTTAAFAAVATLDLAALVGSQLAIGAAILSEFGSRRHTTRWFWGAALV